MRIWEIIGIFLYLMTIFALTLKRMQETSKVALTLNSLTMALAMQNLLAMPILSDVGQH